jgi:TPR repeat protein
MVSLALMVPSLAKAAAGADADCKPDSAARRSVILTELTKAQHDALRFDAPSVAVAAVSTCGVELLSGCRLATRVAFEATPPTESTAAITAADRLRAALPTASADLKHNLAALKGGEVRTLSVGRRVLSRPLVFATEVVGECRGATHLVSQIVYGAVEIRGPAPDRFIFDGTGDPDACAAAKAGAKAPPGDCGEPVAATLTRLAPDVLVAPNAHDAKACKADDPVACTTACALGNASGCTSLARQIEKASAQVESAAGNVESAAEVAATAKKLGVGAAPPSAVVAGAKTLQAASASAGPQAAAALYAAACLAGQNLACNNLGVLSERGIGGPPDPGQAATLYEAACLGGLVRACNNLGTLLRAGKGRPANPVESLALFRAACADGEPMACANLGQQQLAGLGVPPDAVAAVESFRQSCEAGESLGCRNLIFAAKTANRVADAAAALEKACKSGVPGACAAVEQLPGSTPPKGDNQ